MALMLLGGEALTAAEPRLDLIMPRGARQGIKATLEFHGLRLGDTRDVIFGEEGLKLVSLEVVDDKLVRVQLAIPTDCPPGQYGMRLLTHSGISELRSFHVGTLPQQEEQEPNNTPDQAERIVLPRTVDGVLLENDRDYFEFEAQAGTVVSGEVEALRLGTVSFNYFEPLIDPILRVWDPQDKLVVESDDTPLTGHDPCFSFMAPHTGTYRLELRDTVNGGGKHHCYRLHLGNFVRPLQAFPAGGQVATQREVQLLGVQGAGPLKQTVALPRDVFTLPRLTDAGALTSPTPVAFRVSDFPDCLESEPNNDWQTVAGDVAELPQALNGIIDRPGDVDCFRIRSSKTMGVNVRVYCRKVGSPLDPVVQIYNDLGQLVTQGDDSEFMDDMDGHSTDTFCRFYPDAGRIYTLRIAGHQGQGAPNHVYRIEVVEAKDWLVPYLREQVEYSQERMAIAVPRGNRFLTMVGLRRGNFAGAVHLQASQLPPGVHCEPQRAAECVDAIPLVFSAAADAPLGWSGAQITASTERRDGPRGVLHQPIELTIGMPAYTPYAIYRERRLAVAVVDQAPLSVELRAPPTPLVRNGVLPLTVQITRTPECTGDIEVQLPFKPPGVGAQPSIVIPAGESTGLYELSAEANAELGSWNFGVLAMAKVGDGKLWVASDLITVQVAEPYVDAKVRLAAVEQGGRTTIVCPLEWLRPMARPGRAELLGLPHGVTAEPVTVQQDDPTVHFVVEAAEDAPIGKFTTLLCRVSADDGAGPIVHYLDGEGVLRIDGRKPDPATPATSAPEVRPLSRLQQLRKEYAQWLKQQR